MIVPICLAVIPTSAVPEANFVHEAGLFQIPQGIVDGRMTNRGQAPARRLENVVRRRVILPFHDHLKNSFTLGRKLLPLDFAGLFVVLHS
jgi:hypothetical protein